MLRIGVNVLFLFVIPAREAHLPVPAYRQAGGGPGIFLSYRKILDMPE